MDDETFIFYEGVTWGMWLPFRTNPLIDALLEEVLQNLSLADVQPILDKVCAAPGAAAGGRELRSVGHQEQLDLFIELYHRLRDAIELARSAIWDWKREEKDGNPPVFGPGFSQVPGGADYMNRTRVRPNIVKGPISPNYTDIDENLWTSLRHSRTGARACKSRNLVHDVFSIRICS